MKVNKHQFSGFIVGSLLVFIFWVILDLVFEQSFDYILALIYWDFMLAFEIGIIIFMNKIRRRFRK